MENKLEEKTDAELFSEYAHLLWRWAWLLILMTFLSGGIAFLVSKRGTPIYQASTLVMVNGAPGAQTDTYNSLVMSQQLPQTYAQVMITGPILDSVAKRLGFTVDPKSISVQPVLNTQLMRIVVEDTNPGRAALIANTLVTVFSQQLQNDQASRYADSEKNLEGQLANLSQEIQDTANALAALGTGDSNQAQQTQLETTLAQYRQSYSGILQSYEQVRLAEVQSTSNIVQKDPAVPPKDPVRPRPVINGLLAAVVGLLLAVGIVFLIEFLDDTIHDPQEITRKWGIPVLGMIISYDYTKNPLITSKEPRSPVSEAFRSLRTNLQYANIVSPMQTIMVTSPSPQDGKTTIAANLAGVIAQGGRHAVVLDADLRRPRVHKIFQLKNRVGLTDQFIRSKDHFDGAIKQTEIKDLSVITSGSLPPNPSELLGSDKMLEILRQLNSQFDLVIIDTPPTLLVTDALVLAQRVDGVLLVVKPSNTKMALLGHSIEQLRQVQANLLGVVLNDVKMNRSRYYYQGYYYTHKYGRGYQYSEYNSERDKEKDGKGSESSGHKRSWLHDLKKSFKKKND